MDCTQSLQWVNVWHWGGGWGLQSGYSRSSWLLLPSHSFSMLQRVLHRTHSLWGASVWTHPWAAVPLEGMPALPCSTSCSSDLGVHSVVLHSFSSLFLPSQYFLPFLKNLFTEAPPSSLIGSALACGESIAEPAGNSSVWQRTTLDLFPKRPPLLPLATKALPYTFNTPSNLITFYHDYLDRWGESSGYCPPWLQ